MRPIMFLNGFHNYCMNSVGVNIIPPPHFLARFSAVATRHVTPVGAKVLRLDRLQVNDEDLQLKIIEKKLRDERAKFFALAVRERERVRTAIPIEATHQNRSANIREHNTLRKEKFQCNGMAMNGTEWGKKQQQKQLVFCFILAVGARTEWQPKKNDSCWGMLVRVELKVGAIEN